MEISETSVICTVVVCWSLLGTHQLEGPYQYAHYQGKHRHGNIPLFRRCPQHTKERTVNDRRHLPLSEKPSPQPRRAFAELVSDPRQLHGLMGIGLAEGIHLGHALQRTQHILHTMAPVFLRAGLLGGMLGLALLRVPSPSPSRLAGITSTAAVAAIPCFLPIAMILAKVTLSKTSINLSVISSGVALSNSIRLLSLKSHPLRKSKSTPHTFPDAESSFETHLDMKSEDKGSDGFSIFRRQWSVGVVLGAIIVSAWLTLLCALCKWTSHCL